MSVDIRTMNRTAVLTELARRRPSSRRDVAAETGISRATVSRVVEDLIAEGIVVEGDEIVVAGQGRRARELDLRAERAYAVGVDLGASNTRIIVADLVGRPVAAVELPTAADADVPALADWLGDLIVHTAGDHWPAVAAVTLGLPGAVAQETRVVSNAPNLRQVEDPAFLDALERSLERPLLVDNDTNLALLGERRFGEARETPSAAMVTLGAGLGAALSVGDTILQGRHGLIGEFGQLPVGPLGTRLELFLTGPGILRHAADAGVHLQSPAELFDPARDAADPLRAQFDNALLIVLTAIVVSSEPDVIVLGGGIARSIAGDLPRYEASLARSLRFAPRLALPALGDYSGAAGAIVAGLGAILADLGVRSVGAADVPGGAALDLASVTAALAAQQPGR
ncbi:ROK family transcriptional regulator [Microbacterium sp. 2FI]|uniref:ROK family transcriptional regulator n=1 Tax=Microbacterium sp. 2FI TaxID=2502193 RepID=UPI001485200F|nr:ROK family transcriptional regulator [Microbacterium sp. 2FI]